ncbi:MAG: family 78 glycoside hydrolase catalytic domain [Lentisphaeria bacterium]|jgi:hypothetical protein
MRKLSLPPELRAEWIWGAENPGRKETYLFVRGEVTLNQLPAQAELWITAGTFFHLYVNGRHLSYGPPPHPLKGSFYFCRYDITHLLETGPNVVAVLAHHTPVARFAARRKPAGLLVQLQADGKPVLWSDSSWRLQEGACFAGHRPRRTVSGGFAEKVDFARYPQGWTGEVVNADAWRPAVSRGPANVAAGELVPLDGCEFETVWDPARTVCSRGVCQPALAQVHLTFRTLAEKSGPGVYAAQTFFYSERATALKFNLFSDQPAKVLCNHAVAKGHGVGALPPGVELDFAAEYNLRLGGDGRPEGALELHKGWNQVVVCQQVDADSPGVTLLFPDLPAYKLQLFRAPDGKALPGWGLAGPLRIPINNIIGSLDLSGLVREGYDAALPPPSDEAVNLLGHHFEVASEVAQKAPERLVLMQGQFAVLDWGQVLYGVPALRVEGAPGDVVDVLFGEREEGGRVLPCHEGRQNADSLVLGEEPCDWMACSPRGLRYLMVVARAAKGPVKISNVTCGWRRFVTEEQASFECADETLNRIWSTGCRTLDVTLQDYFLDSPCKETAQYIPDAMIQSLAACLIHGNDRFGAKALGEFADGQFETGEMSAVCPSDHFVNIPDYSLLWPVWLHRHHLLAGDDALLKRLMPALQRLVNYFAHLADHPSGLLADLDKKYSAPCFLDHGKIERRGVVTGLNALYCRALWSAAWIAGEAGQGALAQEWKQRASQVALALRGLVYDPQAKRFADCWVDGQRSAAASWQSNILALFGGVAPRDDMTEIFRQFFGNEAPFEKFPAVAADNPYFRFFVLDVALALGRRQWAFDYLKWYWGGMLQKEANTWWEFFSPRLESGNYPVVGTMCHGYGVSPNLLLVTELVGVRPATPGFKAIFFNPLLTAVPAAKAQLSIPGGRLDVEWRKSPEGELEVRLACTSAIEVIPLLDAGIAATFTVNDSVTILASTPEGE